MKNRQQQNNKRLGTALISRLFLSFCLLVESRKVCNIFLRKVFRPPSAVRNRSERETEIKENKRDKSFASGFECHYRQLFCDNYNLCWVATEGWLNDLALLLVERFILLIRIVFFCWCVNVSYRVFHFADDNKQNTEHRKYLLVL